MLLLLCSDDVEIIKENERRERMFFGKKAWKQETKKKNGSEGLLVRNSYLGGKHT